MFAKKRVLWSLFALATGLALALSVRPGHLDLDAEYPQSAFEVVPASEVRYVRICEADPPEELNRRIDETDRFESRITNEKARQAFSAMRENKYVRARELAEAALGDPSAELPARYVLANAMYHGEANAPRALFQIRQARRLAEKLGTINPRDSDARRWYVQSMVFETALLCHLERWDEALKAIDRVEHLYQAMPWCRVFPLLKQGRIEEAEVAISELEALNTWPQVCLNHRIVLRSFRIDRGDGYELAQKLVKLADRPLQWSNFGFSCASDFRFDESRQAFEQANKSGELDFSGSPFQNLAELALQRGEFKATWETLQRAQRQRLGRAAETLDRDQASFEQQIASLLLATSRPDLARPILDRVASQPDRLSTTTSSQSRQQLTIAILQWLVADQLGEQSAELAPGKADSSGQRWQLRRTTWTARRQILKLCRDEKLLKEMLCPHSPSQFALPESWWTQGVVGLLPYAVARQAIELAREQETHPQAAPYFDACQAELEFANGRPAEAQRLGEQALAGLPADWERLLCGRVAAICGESARQLGDEPAALKHFERALADFPGAFRLLKISLPVRIEDDGSPQARQFAEQLLAGPRFRRSKAGFVFKLAKQEQMLTFELRSNDVVRVSGRSPIVNRDDETARLAVAACVQRMASPDLELDSQQVWSLLGSSGVARARPQINAALDSVRPKRVSETGSRPG